MLQFCKYCENGIQIFLGAILDPVWPDVEARLSASRPISGPQGNPAAQLGAPRRPLVA